MSTEYNIPNLFLQGFGLKVSDGYDVKISEKASTPKEGLFSGITIIEDTQEALEKSALGTPILFPIKFVKGSYKRYNQSGEIEVTQMGEFRLPIASIIDFRRAKIIGTTKVNGGRGSVKEIYGFDDWQITINGFIIPDDSQTQGFKTIEQQEAELTKWDNLACAIEVDCPLFTNKRIKYITITEMTFSPMRGRPKIRTFTITALSDEPIELNIKMKV